MSTIFGVLTLIVAVVIANIAHLFFPRLPLAFYQIFVGIFLALWPSISTFTLEPETFLLLIIAPLLFNDGQNASFRAISRNVKQIISMTVYLAIFTVLVAGIGLHFAVAAFSLPLAFMLAAIITPTDAVAVKSLTTGVAMPANVHQTLEHESLFNDASGLVLFSLAASTLASGQFSLVHGLTTFLYVFLGGIIFGALAGWLMIELRLFLMRTNVDIGQIVIPLNVMTPVIVYWLAEELHCSGILAVVAAGIMHSLLNDRLRLTSAKVQIATTTLWQILSDTLNGIVFVFLGLSLPEALGATTPQSLGNLTLIAIFLYLITTGIRYLWARLNFVDLKGSTEDQRKNALVLALGGIHGTITLAMAFSIPTLINGRPLALRNTMILIAALVILISIINGALLFPKLLPPQRNTYTATEFTNGLIAAVQTAIGRIEEAAAHPRERAAVIDQLSSQMTLTYQVNSATYQKILADCHEVEMQLIDELSQEGQIDQFLLDFYQHLITQSVVNHTTHGLRSFIRTFYHRWKWHRIRHKLRQVQVTTATDAVQKEIRNLLARTTWAVNNHLNQVQTSTNVNEVAMVRRLYLNRIRALSRQQRLDQEVMHQLFVSAFQDEHSFIQQALAAGDINADLAKALNEHISIDELVYMQSN